MIVKPRSRREILSFSLQKGRTSQLSGDVSVWVLRTIPMFAKKIIGNRLQCLGTHENVHQVYKAKILMPRLEHTKVSMRSICKAAWSWMWPPPKSTYFNMVRCIRWKSGWIGAIWSHMSSIQRWMEGAVLPMNLGNFYNNLTVLPSPGIMVSIGHHPQMALI